MDTMYMRVICLLLIVLFSRAAVGEDQADPAMLFQEAWYLEEGVRDPAKALEKYNQIVAQFPDRKQIAAKALARAAGCYKKQGNVNMERETWDRAWKDYKEEIAKLPEYQDDSVRISSRIEKDLAESPSDIASVLNRILEQMQTSQIYPVRDKMLKQAEEQEDPLSAVKNLQFAILLSLKKMDDKTTAAIAQSKIGEIWLQHDAPHQALLAYEKAEQDYPNQRSILAWNKMKMAEACRLMARNADAIAFYTELLNDYHEQKEQVLWGMLWMGDCQRELGEIDKALQAWRDVADSEEAEKYPRQTTIARILTGRQLPPETLNPKEIDEFTNDEAFFIAIKYQMNGNDAMARKFLERTMELSKKKDWPYMLASQYLKMLAPTAE